MLGLTIIGGIAVVVIILTLNKEKSITPASSPTNYQVVRVIDGDTIEVNSEKFRFTLANLVPTLKMQLLYHHQQMN